MNSKIGKRELVPATELKVPGAHAVDRIAPAVLV